MPSFNLGFSSQRNRGTSTSTQSGSEAGTSATSQAGTRQTSRLDPEIQQLLNSFTSGRVALAEEDSEFTREAAIESTTDVVGNIFRNFRETTLPQIFSAEGRTGGFNSTAAQQVADNAFGQAVAQSSEVVQNAVQAFAQLSLQQEGQRNQVALEAFNVGTRAGETEVLDQRSASEFASQFTGTTTTASSSRGRGFSLGASGGLG